MNTSQTINVQDNIFWIDITNYHDDNHYAGAEAEVVVEYNNSAELGCSSIIQVR